MTDTVASNPFAPLRWLWGGGAALPQGYGPSIPPQTPPWFPRVPLVGGWGWGDFRPARTELAAWFLGSPRTATGWPGSGGRRDALGVADRMREEVGGGDAACVHLLLSGEALSRLAGEVGLAFGAIGLEPAALHLVETVGLGNGLGLPGCLLDVVVVPALLRDGIVSGARGPASRPVEAFLALDGADGRRRVPGIGVRPDGAAFDAAILERPETGWNPLRGNPDPP